MLLLKLKNITTLKRYYKCFFFSKSYMYACDGGHVCLEGPYEVSAAIDYCLQTQISVTFVLYFTGFIILNSILIFFVVFVARGL